VLAWAVDHDPAGAARLVAALGWCWSSQGRLPGMCPLLREMAGRAEPGSDGWCTAQFWLGYAAVDSNDNPGALGYFTALRDAVAGRPPSRLLADALYGRSTALANTGRMAEAAEEARRGLAVARQARHPAAEVAALLVLSGTARAGGDHGEAVRLARQAAQVRGGIPGLIARWCNWFLARALTDAGDLAAAGDACMAGLARCREAGDLWNEAMLLTHMTLVDLRAGRTSEAAARLREGLQLAAQTGADD
jgi:hypothetical protein